MCDTYVNTRIHICIHVWENFFISMLGCKPVLLKTILSISMLIQPFRAYYSILMWNPFSGLHLWYSWQFFFYVERKSESPTLAYERIRQVSLLQTLSTHKQAFSILFLSCVLIKDEFPFSLEIFCCFSLCSLALRDCKSSLQTGTIFMYQLGVSTDKKAQPKEIYKSVLKYNNFAAMLPRPVEGIYVKHHSKTINIPNS